MPTRTVHLALRLWQANVAHHGQVRKHSPQRLRGNICVDTTSHQHACPGAAPSHPHGSPLCPQHSHKARVGSAVTQPTSVVPNTTLCKPTAWRSHLLNSSEWCYWNKTRNPYHWQAKQKFYKRFGLVRHSNLFGCFSFTQFGLCLSIPKHQYPKRKMSACSENTAW